MMPTNDDDFVTLMARVVAHSEVAAQELLERYEPYLLRAIRRKLHKKIRPKFDSLDFAQDVWASFFADLPEDHTFKSPKDLAAFLTTVAQSKVIDAVRQRLKRQKYNVNREESLDDSDQLDKESLVARQQSPVEILVGKEDWEEFLKKHPLAYQRIFVLLRKGKTSQEIA
jgi:RNA polymerase sigma factor (sigma-70 family)